MLESLLRIVELRGEECLKPLDVKSSGLEAVRLGRESIRGDPVHQEHEVVLATGPEVHDGKVQVGEGPQFALLRRL